MTPKEARPCFHFLLVKEGSEFQNAKVKWIDNGTKVQVPLHLTRRTSRKGPPQYHQMTALATARAVLLATSSKAWPSLHPETFLRNSNFIPGEA
jgi:hypothetical protein